MTPLTRGFLRLASICLFCIAPLAKADTAKPVGAFSANKAATIRPIRLIVGFMGGRVRPDNLLHKEAVIAQELREPNSGNLHVLVFANHNGGSALQTVLNLIDQDGDHHISEAERRAVHIAIYGHSWGASETVALARSLQSQNIPVALTVQVDSVQKPGENDSAIPSNVQEAVNLYQRDGLLRGRAAIHAEDATRTRILVNDQYHYNAQHTVDIARFPWFARTFMRQHIMIENDPEVWARVEGFLKQAMDEHTAAPGRETIAASSPEPLISATRP